MRRSALLLVLGALACAPEPEPSGADAGAPRALCEGAADAGFPDRSGACASAFGAALTSGFGRLDGTALAVVEPGNPRCAWPNADHLVLQVTMGGAAYRMVVNVLSDGRNGTDTKVRHAQVEHALPAPAWSEGWHAGVGLDYATDLGVHAADITPCAMDDLVAELVRATATGAPVSVYATAGSRPESAHLVHRNGSRRDGAIVLDPGGARPRFLLFHFDGQTF